MPESKMNEKAQKAYNEALRRIKECGPHGKELNLSGIGLTKLPPEIGKLQALTVLDLSNNHLTALPSEIGQLQALTGLTIWSNCLEALPPEIGRLRSLTELGLLGNQLTSLPSEIGQLQEIRQLDLDSNQLTTLPPEIGQLAKLEGLFLHGNPDLGLPAEILGPIWEEVYRTKTAKPADPKSILDYYFARQSQGARPLNEVRLVLVGRGAAGKTSLVRRMVNDTFNPAQEETAGIALCDWTMRGCTGEPVTAHVWDFAGQVVTHSMHRYFLSHRTVYVLVLTQREDSAGEDADYWLKLIQSYGMDKTAVAGGSDPGTPGSMSRATGAPPVIVALNKSDQARVKVDRNFLLERFPFIVGFVETDCQSGRGIAELRDKLCALMDDARVKPWVRMGFPRQWSKVKDAILRAQATRPHLSYDDWRKLCAAEGVTDPDKQDEVSALLHTLGVALNYADDPRLHDNTVLRPNWVTGHCYNLIRHAARQGGALHRAELPSVLGAEGEHDPRMHDYLMRLMERFEAAYPLGESYPPERWLVPLGLPDDQPDGLALFGQTPPEKAARLRYTYPSIPPGLIAQFIVRTHPLMEPKFQWASGTVLTLNSARALVRAVSKTEIEITAIGDDVDARRDLAGLCRDEINGLNAQIGGLDVVERTEVVVGRERVWVKMPTLEKDEQKGKTKTAVETNAGSAEVETKKELDEFGTEEGRLPESKRKAWERLFEDMHDNDLEQGGFTVRRRSKPKPRIFISYSHTDERYLKTLNLHLTILKNNGFIHRVWHDRRIQPGMDWDKAIQEEIAKADVVIFLTSTAALASGYINNDELRPALERHVKGEAVIVPIILERCQWVDTFAASDPLKDLNEPRKRVPNALPRDGKPINTFSIRNDGWHQVSEGLKALLTDLKAKLK